MDHHVYYWVLAAMVELKKDTLLFTIHLIMVGRKYADFIFAANKILVCNICLLAGTKLGCT